MVQAVAGEALSRPYLGISFISIDKSIADTEKLDVDAGRPRRWDRTSDGTVVPGVKEGTPAEAAGILDGDIIVSVNGKVIDDEHPLDATLSQFAPGDTVSIVILRDGQTITLSVTLGTRPPGL